jgi:TonB family protein
MKRALHAGLALAAATLIFVSATLPARAQQERPGVPEGGAQPGFTLTRHGDVLFEANIAESNAITSRVLLTETVEIYGVKNSQGWLDFVHAFAAATGPTMLASLPPDASKKKGKVIVAFSLRHDGSLEGSVSVERSSHDEAIDDATRLAVAKSAPFRALPQEFAGATAQFRVTFAYNHPHPLHPSSGDSQ